MALSSWSYDKIQLWLVLPKFGPSVNGAPPSTVIPIVRAQIDFELNAIPRALVYLPVGRDSATGKPSPVHQVLSAFQTQKPAQLWCSVTPRFASGKVRDFGIPTEPFVLFDGLTVGLGQSKSRGGMSFYLALQHWLGQLNFSSTVSASSYPVNPRNYTFGAMLPNQANSGTKDYVGPYDPAQALTFSSITNNLWDDALSPFFQGLAQQDNLAVLEQGKQATNKANDGAIAALKKISSSKLPLELSAQVDSNATELMRQDVCRLSMDPENLAHHTFWDVIVGNCAPNYFFSIVPQIETALAVPYVPAVRTSYTTISADEYVQIDRSRSLIRPLKAVGLLSNLSSSTGADGNASKGLPGVGGWYQTNDVLTGMTLITGGPRWTQEIVAVTNYAAEAAGGKQKPVAAADAPDAAGAPNPNIKDGAQNRAKSTIKPILDKLARCRFVHEMTAPQQGTISGPFRLDIAPGACVQVEGSNELTIADDAAGLSFFGTVLRTSLMIDAERPAAGTAFHLAHLRSLDENTRDSTSIATHPLYTSTFYGAGLIGAPSGKTGV